VAAVAWWTDRLICVWLAELGLRPGGPVDVERLVPGPDVPEMPDRLAVVTSLPGPGESHEGIFDTPGFQLRIRGDQHDPAGAQRRALAADRLIRFSGFPRMVADPDDPAAVPVYLLRVQRAGGRPSVLGDAADDADRTTYVCTYLPTVAEE
jgi:hypothetical protein